MKTSLQLGNETYKIDLSKPLDISLPLQASTKNPIAWYLDAPKIEPVKMGDWVAKVSQGASVNFNNIEFNPHAHGTHTECVGHISKEFYSINDTLKTFFYTAEVISVTPEQDGEDLIISEEQIRKGLEDKSPQAIIIRVLPNTVSKKSKKYSNTNWPYLHYKAASFIRKKGIEHLLIDLPSVDKEKDEGKLLAHKAFWNYPKNPRIQATITELIYVPNTIKDGSYILNLMIASFHNDATPSKPILYTI
ncbi:MAG: cyclase family protein [Flavobacteriaceae bacterium]|nr:cyclase family protein [Flavobacteriaceae bacterium]